MYELRQFVAGFFVLFLFSFGLSAQNTAGILTRNEPAIIPDLLFERFGSKDNMPDNRIRSIFQDKYGVLWIGTMNGVCQYDGYSFKKFISSNDPERRSGTWTADICEDSLQNIWLATTDGLNVYNKLSEKVIHFDIDPQNPNSIVDNDVKTLFCDQQKNLWIGTAKGLMRFDQEKNNFVRFNEYPLNTRINKIVGSYDDFIWIACYDGVVHYNVKTGKYNFYKREVKASPYGDRIWSVLEVDRNLLIGTGGEGLLQLNYNKANGGYSTFEPVNISNKKPGQFKEFEIYDICRSKTGDIWLGTGRGLAKVQYPGTPEMKVSFFENNPTNELSLCNNRVYRVFIDRTDVLWCGTEVGLSKLDLALLPFKFYSFVGQNAKDPIRSIYTTDQGNIWVGTADRGVFEYNPSTGKTISYHFPNVTASLYSTRSIIKWKGKMWIGTLGGAFSIYPEQRNSNFEIELEGTAVFAFLVDSKNNLWIGTNHGLYLQNTSGKRILYTHNPKDGNSISSNFIRSIYEDHSGRIWIGFDNKGINFLDPANGKFSSIGKGPDGKKIVGSIVLSIIEYPENTIWIGSEVALNRIIIKQNGQHGNPEFEIKNYFEENGMVDSAINGILQDGNGNLWLSTIKGLVRFNTQNESFENFLPNLRFNQGSFFNGHNRQLFFGGAEGFVSFEPTEITNNQYLPRTVISDLRLFNQPVKINQKYNEDVVLEQTISQTKHITLNYKNNAFTLGFTAMHFSNPGKNKYAYKMEGFDEKWINTDAESRFATYTNLNSGDFIFQVKATNNSGLWSENPATIKITILPPPWKTWYAILGYIMVFNLLLFIFIRYALIQNRQRNQIRFDRLEKERMNSLYQMKMRFFTDVSHEFRTPLSLIIGPTDDILNDPTFSDHVRAKVVMIQRNCKRLLNLVDELMTFRKIDLGIIDLKISNSDLVGLITDIVLAFKPLADKKEVSLGIIAPEKIENVWFDPRKMEKIMNNLISNALKNTREKGSIVVQVEPVIEAARGNTSSQALGYVCISVEDNGTGIEEKDINSIFDRFFQTKTSKSGTGVGLSLTKSLVELHKGFISVESTPGVITCFKVLIPLGKDHFDPTQLVDETGSSKPFVLETDTTIYAEEHLSKPVTGSFADDKDKPTLLIVEDNLELREYLAMLFIGQYRVFESGNGVEAMETMATDHPDIIISDVMMPDMDGIELCRKIKSSINTCHIPIILLTAKTALENVMEGVEVGADLYISKPFQPDLLKLQVENLILSRKRIIQKFRSGEISTIKDITINPLDEIFMDKVVGWIMKNIDNDEFGVEELGQDVGMSRSNLFRKLKAITGQTPIEFIYFVRLKRSMELLLERKLNVSEIAYEVGFKNPSSFSKSFKKQFGQSPSQFLNELIERQTGKKGS
jgi:signal transduction histidine kinase/ligand-binding sensor domain-containing protein/DNA-binding response OmpR family regulator